MAVLRLSVNPIETLSKRFCSNAVSSDERVIEGPNARDHIALCAFNSFLVEVQMNVGYIHATHA